MNQALVYEKYFPSIYLTKYKDMPKEYLGEFEELILTMFAALQEDAYGAGIADEIEVDLPEVSTGLQVMTADEFRYVPR